jgi:glyoxylate/hydroxypyruvate reductase
MKNSAILIAATGWDQRAWAAPIVAAEPGRRIEFWPDIRDPAAVGYAVVWQPAEGVFARLDNLKAVFSMGAGVDHLMFRDDIPDVPIVRMVNPDLTCRMTEWVTLQVLSHLRQQPTYAAQQGKHRWHELRQPAANEVRVGIMGMGVLGSDAAEVLVRLGFQVAGWSRRAAHVAGVQSFHGREQLDAFLARTDILVSLLPLTPETRGLLALPLFRKLARDGKLGAPVLINAGRGGLQVEADIVAALDADVLGGASLDVFETEPLPASSPLWGRQDVIITPHCAAWSSPEALAIHILNEIVAFERGAPLKNVVNRAAFY